MTTTKNLLATSLGALLALAASAANATAEYKVWHYVSPDTLLDVQPGDITAGNVKLTPPAFACGIRFNMPAYWDWSDTTGNGNFNKDVFVWIPKAGCPYPNDIVVEYTDHSQTFAYKVGNEYRSIFTNYGKNWVNAQGKVPPCNCIPNFPYKISAAKWESLAPDFDRLKADVRNPAQPARAQILARTMLATLSSLATEAAGRVELRRRTPLSDREAAVRALEDGALRKLATAQAHMNTAFNRLSAGIYDEETHTEVDLGRENSIDAGKEFEEALDLIAPTSGD
ncbi:MAG TPA: hypothetical protein VJ724_09885 [Tahibacter sp.]|nr:hypothetical protein [Tahibacter sp.]